MITIRVSHKNIINYCYLVFDNHSKEGIIIDPAWNLNLIVQQVQIHRVHIKAVLVTHHHNDHINLSDWFVQKYQIAVWMHRKEFEYYEPLLNNIKLFYRSPLLKIGHTPCNFLHTPGHTKGSVCYWIDNYLFTGDTIYMEGCGVCGGLGGSAKEMYQTIQALRNSIPNETYVFSGHSFGKSQGQLFSDLLKSNIYFNIFDEKQFISFRMRKINSQVFQ